jgi:hypothetical protein
MTEWKAGEVPTAADVRHGIPGTGQFGGLGSGRVRFFGVPTKSNACWQRYHCRDRWDRTLCMIEARRVDHPTIRIARHRIACGRKDANPSAIVFDCSRS